MSVLLTAVIFPLAVMLTPIYPPIISALFGFFVDRARREAEDPTQARVEEAKARSAARRTVAPAPQTA